MLLALSLWMSGCSAGSPLSMLSATQSEKVVHAGGMQNEDSGDPEQAVQVDYPRPPEPSSSAKPAVKQPGDNIQPSPTTKPNSNKTGSATEKPKSNASSEETEKPDKQEKKLVALTFDDGPDSRYTTAILDILKEKGVKATFFVVGQQVEKEPETLKRIVDEGHAVGNHTMNHKQLPKLTDKQMKQEIESADKLIEKVIGYKPTMVRAPYGAVSDALKKYMKSENRQLVGWNVDTRDWAGTSVSDMRSMIKEKAKPGAIILMHSFGSKNIKHTVEMLPGAIDDLKKMGYTFVTADQLVS
ncbi:polysaccharide deacetylase family protein [Paenibacillus sp. NEAU-GSW1]|uniref:polysaccharide deacetylase family protein n=1 Tax=Paenibacillus sp. NEAU-GSW1 TaxID=2682486 RepID=UPI001C129BA0|nr:polysaccharide deacetylase family protein [Paenibacillus sp. NEAU-GSW1]